MGSTLQIANPGLYRARIQGWVMKGFRDGCYDGEGGKLPFLIALVQPCFPDRGGDPGL